MSWSPTSSGACLTFGGKLYRESQTEDSFTDADHSLKISGRALQAALNQSRVNDRLQEALVLVLELLRAGVLHDAMYREGPHGPLSGGPSLPTPDDERHMLLVMRVFGTLNLTCRVRRAAH